jgi:hypothetical protein
VTVNRDMAILSLVGKQMRHLVGIAGRMFTTLGQGNVNIEMISQGANEINISCVIEGREAVKALNLIHQSCLQVKPEGPKGRGAWLVSIRSSGFAFLLSLVAMCGFRTLPSAGGQSFGYGCESYADQLVFSLSSGPVVFLICICAVRCAKCNTWHGKKRILEHSVAGTAPFSHGCTVTGIGQKVLTELVCLFSESPLAL